MRFWRENSNIYQTQRYLNYRAKNHANTILAIFGAKIQYQKYQLQRNNYKQTALKSKQIAEKCKQKAVKK